MLSVMEREAGWPASGGKNMQTCKPHCLFDSCEEKSFCVKDKQNMHTGRTAKRSSLHVLTVRTIIVIFKGEIMRIIQQLFDILSLYVLVLS